MGILKNVDIVLFISVTFIAIITPSQCQLLSSATSSSIDLLAESIKTVLRLDSMLETFRKVSSGVVPFPFFIPIPQKSRVIELFGFRRSKKLNKETPLQKKQISTSSSQIMPISVPPPPGMLTQMPIMNQLRPMDAANSFYNYRHNYDLSDFPAMFAEMNAQQPIIDDYIRDNSLEMSSFDYTNGDDSENSYAERSDTEMQRQNRKPVVHLSDDLMGDETIGNPMQMIQNWEALDFELKRLGNRLGRLGALLKKDQLKIR